MTKHQPLAPGRLAVGGCPEGFDARYLAGVVARAGGPVIHVARDDARLAAMRAGLRFFAGDLPILHLPAWDCLPYDRISPNTEISAARMATLAALADGFDRPAVLLTTVNAATQRVPAREMLAGASFTARVGARVDLEGLRGWLARMGYSNVPDGDGAGRIRGAGRVARPLSAGGLEAGPARLLRRCARGRAALRSREPAHLGAGDAGRVGAGLGGGARRGRDRAVPHAVSRDVRGGGLGRSALRGGECRAQASGLRALAAVLSRSAGDGVRLSARRSGAARRPARRGAGCALGLAHRPVRGAARSAGKPGQARHGLQAGAAGRALSRRGGLGFGAGGAPSA